MFDSGGRNFRISAKPGVSLQGSADSLMALAQDSSKEQAFPMKFSCAQFYMNDITDTWPNHILFHCFNTQGSTIEAHLVCENKLEHPGTVTESTAQSQLFSIYVLTQFSHILAVHSRAHTDTHLNDTVHS